MTVGKISILDWELSNIGPEILDMAIVLDRDPEISGMCDAIYFIINAMYLKSK